MPVAFLARLCWAAARAETVPVERFVIAQAGKAVPSKVAGRGLELVKSGPVDNTADGQTHRVAGNTGEGDRRPLGATARWSQNVDSNRRMQRLRTAWNET
jgi:hypothetical protein